MSTPAPVIKGATAASDAVRDWQAVRGDASIQYAPLPAPPPIQVSEPSSLEKFLRALFEPIGQALGMSWGVLQWVLLGLLALAVIYAIARLLEPAFERRRKSAKADASEAEWAPSQDEALALLGDADRLAAEGRFDEATHLLLQRSVQHIAAARPAWVKRASTAREIAAISDLSDGARGTFALIAGRVERSLFALRRLDAGDWQAAREAYASFALERIAAV